MWRTFTAASASSLAVLAVTLVALVTVIIGAFCIPNRRNVDLSR